MYLCQMKYTDVYEYLSHCCYVYELNNSKKNKALKMDTGNKGLALNYLGVPPCISRAYLCKSNNIQELLFFKFP
jgi:hypothetical protein